MKSFKTIGAATLISLAIVTSPVLAQTSGTGATPGVSGPAGSGGSNGADRGGAPKGTWSKKKKRVGGISRAQDAAKKRSDESNN